MAKRPLSERLRLAAERLDFVGDQGDREAVLEAVVLAEEREAAAQLKLDAPTGPDALRQVVEEKQLGPFAAGSDTSRKAAVANYPRAGSQRHRVLEAVARAGDSGVTRDELVARLELPDSSVDPRVWELVNDEFIRESDIERRTRAGAMARALVLAPRGREWWVRGIEGC